MVRSGPADEQILTAVTESRARLLVIATHGRSGIGRWMYGSIAGRMLHDAPVPVVAVGPRVLEKAASDVRIVGMGSERQEIDRHEVLREEITAARQGDAPPPR